MIKKDTEVRDARGRDAEVQCGVMWPGMQDVVASDHTTQTTQVPHRLLPHLLNIQVTQPYNSI